MRSSLVQGGPFPSPSSSPASVCPYLRCPFSFDCQSLFPPLIYLQMSRGRASWCGRSQGRPFRKTLRLTRVRFPWSLRLSLLGQPGAASRGSPRTGLHSSHTRSRPFLNWRDCFAAGKENRNLKMYRFSNKVHYGDPNSPCLHG